MCFCTPSIRTPFCHNCNTAMFQRITELRTERDEQAAQIELLLSTITFLLPTLLNSMYKEEASYGKNFSGNRTDKARECVAKARKALSTTPSQALADFTVKVRNEAYEKAADVADYYTKASYLGKVGEATRNLKELP